MINLYNLAKLSRLRASERIKDKSRVKDQSSRVYAVTSQPFDDRLIDACKRVADKPSVLKDVDFISLPERLIGKLVYLTIGKTRSEKVNPDISSVISENDITYLKTIDVEGQDAQYKNLDSSTVFNHIKQILICHGLSPIGDSILLLSDLGRCCRYSLLSGLPMNVMLADISWMSSNRSIRQFNSITEATIDTGLRVCLDKRRRLYESLKITTDLREITPYERANTISYNKLKLISNNYISLAKMLWDITTEEPLTFDKVKIIANYLDNYGRTSALPNALSVLSQFPNALASLERELKPHLEIIRTIAKQFNSLNDEIFKYFFAQYYAQQVYRGNSIKIAPISEKKFDEPFDSLDLYFQAWGEGHSTVDMLLKQTSLKKSAELSAIYLPQYQLGTRFYLPYSPLSLDALKFPEKDHNIILQNIICIDNDNFEEHHIKDILKLTPVYNRNRLIADLYSFVFYCIKIWSFPLVNDVLKEVIKLDFKKFIDSSPEILKNSILQELDLNDHSSFQEMWSAWLKTIEIDEVPSYLPANIFFLLQTNSDWDEKFYSWAINLIKISKALYISSVK